MSCISDTDNYFCYSPEKDKVYSIQRHKMDELLDWSEKQQLFDNSEISDFSPDRDDSPSSHPPSNLIDKRGLDIIASNDRPTQLRMSLPDVLSYESKRYYPFNSFIYRKRPFDSISYRGQFGRFGRR